MTKKRLSPETPPTAEDATKQIRELGALLFYIRAKPNERPIWLRTYSRVRTKLRGTLMALLSIPKEREEKQRMDGLLSTLDHVDLPTHDIATCQTAVRSHLLDALVTAGFFLELPEPEPTIVFEPDDDF